MVTPVSHVALPHPCAARFHIQPVFLLLLHIFYGSGFSECCPMKLEAVGLQADAEDVVDIVIPRRQHVQ